MEILIISPFKYALEKCNEYIKELLFLKGYNDYTIYVAQAMPDEIESKIMGKTFDIAYADRNYSNEEIGLIREHLRGRNPKVITF